MKKHPILTAIGILFLVVLVSSVVNMGGSLPSSTPAPKASAKPASRMPATIAAMFDDSLSQAFGSNYQTELDTDAGIFRVDTWSSDVNAQFINDLQNGNISIEAWNAVVDRVKTVTSSMQSTFDETCEEPITVVSSICDPINHDLPYLTVANGVAGYDVVNGVDLLNK